MSFFLKSKTPELPASVHSSEITIEPRLAIFIKLAAFFLSFIVVSTTISGIFITYRATPLADYWDHINWLRAIDQRGFLISDLFRQANEHRIAVPRLFFLLDDAFFRSSGVFCTAVIVASFVALIGLHLHVHSKVALAPVRRTIFVCISIALGFLFIQSENFLWPYQVQFLFVYLFAATAIWAAIRITEDGPRAGATLHAGLVLSLVVSAYSMANGVLAVFPVLLLFVIHRRWSLAVIYAALGGILLASYLYGYDRPSYHPDPVGALRNAATLVLQHFLITLGGGVSRLSQRPGIVLGSLGFFYLTWRALRWVFGGRVSPTEEFALLVSLFVVGSLLITSAGRAELAVSQGTSSRYQTPVHLFWINLSLLALTDPKLNRFLRGPVLAGGFAVFAALALVLQVVGFREAVPRQVRLDVAADALVAGVPDPEAILGSFPILEIPLNFSDLLRRDRLSFFADQTYDRVGTRLPPGQTGFMRLTDAGVVGFSLTELTHGTFRGTLVKATLERVSGRLFGRRFLIVDPCNTVIGVGRLSTSPNPVAVTWNLTAKPSYLRGYISATTPACEQWKADLGSVRILMASELD